MYRTEELVVSATKENALFKTLLLLYPKPYRDRFGEEMLLVFQDLCQEQRSKQGQVGMGFWLSVFTDTLASASTQHLAMMRRHGMKNYLQQTLHINKYNVVGAILLLPFAILIGSDFVGRLLQGDFSHPNMTWVGFLSRTILYGDDARWIWVFLVLAPLGAALLNLIPILRQIKPKSGPLSLKALLRINPLAVVILGLGLVFLVIAFGHDVIPCFAHHLFSDGLENIGHTISVCREA